MVVRNLTLRCLDKVRVVIEVKQSKLVASDENSATVASSSELAHAKCKICKALCLESPLLRFFRHHPSDDVLIQLDLFDEHEKADNEEFSGEENITDPKRVFNSLFCKVHKYHSS